MSNLAQIDLGPTGGFRGIGPLGLEGEAVTEAPKIFNNVISTTVGVITLVGIIWFVIQIFTGAVAIIGGGGDKQKVAEARQRITTSLIGIILLISAIFLIDLVGFLLGVGFLGGTNIIPALRN